MKRRSGMSRSRITIKVKGVNGANRIIQTDLQRRLQNVGALEGAKCVDTASAGVEEQNHARVSRQKNVFNPQTPCQMYVLYL
jgi:hypothetical protein